MLSKELQLESENETLIVYPNRESVIFATIDSIQQGFVFLPTWTDFRSFISMLASSITIDAVELNPESPEIEKELFGSNPKEYSKNETKNDPFKNLSKREIIRILTSAISELSSIDIETIDQLTQLAPSPQNLILALAKKLINYLNKNNAYIPQTFHHVLIDRISSLPPREEPFESRYRKVEFKHFQEISTLEAKLIQSAARLFPNTRFDFILMEDDENLPHIQNLHNTLQRHAPLVGQRFVHYQRKQKDATHINIVQAEDSELEILHLPNLINDKDHIVFTTSNEYTPKVISALNARGIYTNAVLSYSIADTGIYKKLLLPFEILTGIHADDIDLLSPIAYALSKQKDPPTRQHIMDQLKELQNRMNTNSLSELFDTSSDLLEEFEPIYTAVKFLRNLQEYRQKKLLDLYYSQYWRGLMDWTLNLLTRHDMESYIELSALIRINRELIKTCDYLDESFDKDELLDTITQIGQSRIYKLLYSGKPDAINIVAIDSAMSISSAKQHTVLGASNQNWGSTKKPLGVFGENFRSAIQDTNLRGILSARTNETSKAMEQLKKLTDTNELTIMIPEPVLELKEIPEAVPLAELRRNPKGLFSITSNPVITLDTKIKATKLKPPTKQEAKKEPKYVPALRKYIHHVEANDTSTNATLSKLYGEIESIPKEILEAKAGRLSPHTIDSYLTCPRNFLFSYILDLKEEAVVTELAPSPLDTGKLAHMAMELLTKQLTQHFQKRASLKSLIQTTKKSLYELAEEYTNLAIASSAHQHNTPSPLLVQQATELVYTFLKLELQREGTWYPIAVETDLEKDFEFEGHSVKLRGKIDRIDISADGCELLIIDYKKGDYSSGFIKYPSQIDTTSSPKGLQMSIYAVLLNEELDKKERGAPLESIDPNAIQSITTAIYSAKSSKVIDNETTRSKKGLIRIDRTDPHSESTQGTYAILELVKYVHTQILASNFPPRGDRQSCDKCDCEYKFLCGC